MSTLERLIPSDTVEACRDIVTGEASVYMAAAYYVLGHGAPHYPVPAVSVNTDRWPIVVRKP